MVFFVCSWFWFISTHSGNQIFTGAFYNGYGFVSTVPDFCWDGIQCKAEPIVDNPKFETYNLDNKLNIFLQVLNAMVNMKFKKKILPF